MDPLIIIALIEKAWQNLFRRRQPGQLNPPGQANLPVLVNPPGQANPPVRIVYRIPAITFSDRMLNVVRWVFFSAFIASLPILLGILSLPLHRIQITVENTIGHGELLLVSTAILGEAVGDVILTEKLNLFVKIALTGLNLIIFGIAIYLFGDIVLTSACSVSILCNSAKDNSVIDFGFVAGYSYIIFGATFVSGIGCKFMAER